MQIAKASIFSGVNNLYLSEVVRVYAPVHFSQDAVGAGVGPVRLGYEARLDIVEDAPRVVHVGVPETVSVVPEVRDL